MVPIVALFGNSQKLIENALHSLAEKCSIFADFATFLHQRSRNLQRSKADIDETKSNHFMN